MFRKNPLRDTEEFLQTVSSLFPSKNLSLDMYTDDDSVVIVVDANQFSPDELDVHVGEDGRSIVVESNKTVEKRDDVEYLWQERQSETARRRVLLPNPVTPDEVTAEYNNGVLTITAPNKQTQTETIEITTTE